MQIITIPKMVIISKTMEMKRLMTLPLPVNNQDNGSSINHSNLDSSFQQEPSFNSAAPNYQLDSNQFSSKLCAASSNQWTEISRWNTSSQCKRCRIPRVSSISTRPLSEYPWFKWYSDVPVPVTSSNANNF